jgi:DNA-binding NtrC family response regulator
VGGERCLVLVAEDDEVTRQMLVLQLQKAGFDVRAAGDGREAMDLLDSRVSVCLFDLNMPGATGMECLRYVQSAHPETPVIILTASGEIQDAIAAMRDGAFDYLTKPCRIANVLARLEEAVRARLRSAEEGASLNALLAAPATESSTISETVVDHRLQRDVT